MAASDNKSAAYTEWAEFYDAYAEDSEGFVRDALGVGPDVWEPNPDFKPDLAVSNDNPEQLQLSGIDPWQLKALKAYDRRERRISIVSGHGVGKSTYLSWITIHHILFRYPQRTVGTAPSSTQLFDAYAAECKSWIKRLPKVLEDLLEVTSERIELKSDAEGSFVSWRTSRADQPEALAGVHSEWVLLIADEASGVPDIVFQAAGGSMSGHNAITVLTGNGVRATGLFYDTHHKLKYRWWTLRVNCEESPRVSKDFIEEQKIRYGATSNAYRVRVLGLFPVHDDDTIIGRTLAASALYRPAIERAETRPVWGADIARGGTDKSALAKRKGRVLREKVIEWAGKDLMQSAGKIKAEWDATPLSERPIAINIDAIGIGAGVADRLRELGLPAFAVNVSESPAMQDKYRNLKTELWFLAEAWFQKRDCSMAEDTETVEQLVDLRFEYTSDGKYWAETKKKLKARGIASPNRAEAFILTFAFEAATLSGQTEVTRWNEPVRRNIKGIV